VGKGSLKRWTLIIGLAAWVGLGWLMPLPCAAQDVYGSATAPKSSVTGSIKQGFNKVGNFLTPTKSNNKQSPTDDAISLKTQSKPGPELYSAIAKLYEESGKYPEAEQYYQMALKEKPDDLTSLLGYARFQENQGRFNEAVALYQKAVQTHPKEAGAFNNLGLCYARRGKLNEAASALSQAVQLDPRNPLYRNNLSTVLVDQNRLAEAFTNLREVHGDAAAYYNVGYLLNKKGNTEAAEHHFAQALRIDPTMAPAQRWLNYLHDKSLESAMGGQSNDGAVRMSSVPNSSRFPAKVISPPASAASSPTSYSTQNPMASPAPNKPSRLPPSMDVSAALGGAKEGIATPVKSDAPPLPPAISSPQRLPPVSLHQPAGSTETFHEMPNLGSADPAAPLPPGTR